MMLRVSKAAGFAALVLLCAGAESVAQAPAPTPNAVAALEPGLWEFKEVGRTAAPERHCITSLRELLQPVQPRLSCKHFIAENADDHTAIAYDCAARGQGRTALRVETKRLLRIDSQGVAEGRPFSVRLEARRIGACLAASR
ncbi:MAG: hypothetical protein J7494_01260 [Sphingobium sp.]|nr:hypothetical protein [Sphingobium sp.]